ncbi:MAG TPA: aquaporin [Candidatus Dormibacteraeota bacterium]|nr:aquaporin [Candidatus Dormibacteraeota bacterium]
MRTVTARGLGGQLAPPSLGHPPRNGWHWREWAAEGLGTGLLALGGLSAVCLDFGTGSPMLHLVPSSSIRLLITGLLFAGTGSLVAISPLGRLSGAHLNPAVTLAFWTSGHVSRSDLLGYLGSQFTGALVGVTVLRLAWGRVAISLQDGRTSPHPGVTPAAAVGIEALLTAVLVLAIFAFTSSARTARLTPLALWIVIALLVWRGAPYTGCSMNPARSLAPAVISGDFSSLWIYLVGPPLGALVAAWVFVKAPLGLRPVTAKLYHDAAYPSVLGTSLRVRSRNRTET